LNAHLVQIQWCQAVHCLVHQYAEFERDMFLADRERIEISDLRREQVDVDNDDDIDIGSKPVS